MRNNEDALSIGIAIKRRTCLVHLRRNKDYNRKNIKMHARNYRETIFATFVCHNAT